MRANKFGKLIAGIINTKLDLLSLFESLATFEGVVSAETRDHILAIDKRKEDEMKHELEPINGGKNKTLEGARAVLGARLGESLGKVKAFKGLGKLRINQ